jgi:hypothetical protein
MRCSQSIALSVQDRNNGVRSTDQRIGWVSKQKNWVAGLRHRTFEITQRNLRKMLFVQFLADTPAVAFMLLLAVLLILVPVASLLYSRRKSGRREGPEAPSASPPSRPFLGTQLDLAILLIAVSFIAGVASWAYKAYFE